MRAATIRDGEIVVAEHPDPVPGVGEVLVRVHAAGLNGADLLQKSGRYPAPPGHPQDIPGLEFAGEVVGRGPAAERFAEGARVTGITGGGGQGELLTVHERQITPAPDGLDWVQAGGFSEVFTTAHDAIVTQAGLRPGERLLIHGAAGGVGTAGVQLGHAIGAHVTASVRSRELHDGVAALGAHEVVFPDLLADRDHEVEPFDVVLDLVGAPNLAVNLRRLAIGGRIVVIGVGGGAKGEINLHALMSARGRIMASTLRARPLEEKAAAARRIEREVLPLVERGAITVPVAASYPLDDAAAAYDRFAAGGKLGKIVLDLG
ncbi:zinc-binding dehydrogenase [Patulibacter sp. NPDC049589]|uniref:zinc-binding dehydrogenase n=1 Tax=Patulibacter sp. NPDC049589 TaxID=3154731 RepID=UPI00343E6DA8